MQRNSWTCTTQRVPLHQKWMSSQTTSLNACLQWAQLFTKQSTSMKGCMLQLFHMWRLNQSHCFSLSPSFSTYHWNTPCLALGLWYSASYFSKVSSSMDNYNDMMVYLYLFPFQWSNTIAILCLHLHAGPQQSFGCLVPSHKRAFGLNAPIWYAMSKASTRYSVICMLIAHINGQVAFGGYLSCSHCYMTSR